MEVNKSHCHIAACGLIFLSLLSGAGCNLSNTKAEETNRASGNAIEAEAKFRDDAGVKQESPKKVEPPITGASVAGTYEYDTYQDGEGYDNELEIKDAGVGKLYVFISGSYIYRVGETQSFHEAEGKGDARLSGSTANAVLVDEAGKPCRATINFKKNEATVKIPDTCRFNVRLGGAYKRASSKTVEKKADDVPKTREIPYDKVMNFVNDFDNHRPGERYVITGAPANIFEKQIRADEFGNQSYKNLFYLEKNDTEESYDNAALLTSEAMIESLAREAEHGPATLRLTVVLVESNGKFDVYRMSFVTKIEGLNDDGSVVWTADGAEPAKTKFTH